MSEELKTSNMEIYYRNELVGSAQIIFQTLTHQGREFPVYRFDDMKIKKEFKGICIENGFKFTAIIDHKVREGKYLLIPADYDYKAFYIVSPTFMEFPENEIIWIDDVENIKKALNLLITNFAAYLRNNGQEVPADLLIDDYDKIMKVL